MVKGTGVGISFFMATLPVQPLYSVRTHDSGNLGHGELRTCTATFPESNRTPFGYFQTKHRRNFVIPKNLWRVGNLVSSGLGQKVGGIGEATADEASALSIEILLSGAKPKMGSKVIFNLGYAKPFLDI